MHAWPAPDVPDLPGTGLPLRLHDTATGEVRPTAPGPTARMYVCGITPYDATHIGHAATYVTFDLVHRVWRDAGHDVHYVQNVTDVDDPLLERAARDGEDWRGAGRARDRRCSARTWRRSAVLPPRDYVGAVEAIPDVVDAVRRLRERGAAYDVDGDTYFSVHSDPRFGGVGNLDDETMLALFAERGGDPERPGKKHPLDCLLWQAARPGEPSWETGDPELPAGRPGWHIECAAIALTHLGDGFDVQGGGSDLVFPHHEMSASEGQVLTGQLAVRPALRARRDGRPRRREDVEVARATWSSSRRCAATAATRWRSGWRCSRTTTAATGPGPTTTSPPPRRGWPAGGRRWPGRPDRRPTRCWPRSAGTWPTTWTPRRPGRGRPLGRRGRHPRRADATPAVPAATPWSRRRDVGPTPCSASGLTRRSLGGQRPRRW